MLKQICTSKPQSLLIGCPSKHLNRTFSIKFKGDINCNVNEKSYHLLKPRNSLIGYCPESFGKEQNVEVFRKLSSGFCSKNGFGDYRLIIARGLSSSSSQKFGEGSEKTLPWLAKAKTREFKKRSKLPVAEKASQSPWEVSAEKFLKGGESTMVDKEPYISKGRENGYTDKDEVSAEKFRKGGAFPKGDKALYISKGRQNGYRDKGEVSANKFRKGGALTMGDNAPYLSKGRQSAEKFREGGASTMDNKAPYRSKGRPNDYRDKGESVEEVEGEVERFDEPKWDKIKPRFNRFDEGRRVPDRPNYRDKGDSVEEVEGEVEGYDEPRWDKIKPRFNRFDEGRRVPDRPEFRKWSKEENWGRNTWKEATESTVPKLVGEGIYGVGPILAALLAERREFYAIYVQDGIDLSGNNRKKKDKKGFEKILRMAEKIGLTKKEVSKHDLNMVVDNRPHQGLVLDASPLEMVSVKELEPVSVDEESGPLWVALDEVTDPQNLGAIIRSSYFFGASGVVLCAKNSAPLSGVVSKASAGSLELLELRSCKNMMQFLTSSAENGWRVLGGSVSSRAVPLNDIVPGAPTILVLGSEGTGLRPLVERSCTELVKIPGNAPVNLIAGADEEDAEAAEIEHGVAAQEFSSFMAVESLNVSVAAGVLLHHLIGSNHLEESK